MALTLENITVTLHGKPLIAPFSLSVAPGEMITIMGPSGAGKSTLLAAIAGDLEPPFAASGRILLGGQDLTDLPPEKRGIGRLFQDDLLFPHLTVGENLLFGISRRGVDRLALMRQGLGEIGLEGFEDRPPHALSGGQRARVALMRALLAEPAAMLLDEPFNKLDASLRKGMRDFVFSHLAERGIPCLMVTHDRDDAPRGGRVLRLDGAELKDD